MWCHVYIGNDFLWSYHLERGISGEHAGAWLNDATWRICPKKLNLNDAFDMQFEPDSLDSMITVFTGTATIPLVTA